jgi:predicted RNA methylase
MTQAFFSLKTVTDALLSPEMDYTRIREASLALKKLFSDAVAFDEMESTNESDIRTDAGKAIAPKWAAFCLIDMMRTRKFILGIRDAIEERLRINPGKPVTVLYAGTGPFASLLTPLITVFKPVQLQMVLIEINSVSIHYLQKIIHHFGMEEYIIELVQADAVTYSIPGNQQPDIIVSETMNNGLQKEPQVSIVANLLSQCSENTILIPELVRVDVCLMGNIIDHPEDIILLKTLLDLDAETARCIKNDPENVPALSPGINVTIPKSPESKYRQLVLCTFIRVFGQHSLGFNESGLTVPHILRMTDSFIKFPVHLLFRYVIESNPGFRVTEIQNLN